jgi:hypothetical protein
MTQIVKNIAHLSHSMVAKSQNVLSDCGGEAPSRVCAPECLGSFSQNSAPALGQGDSEHRSIRIAALNACIQEMVSEMGLLSQNPIL